MFGRMMACAAVAAFLLAPASPPSWHVSTQIVVKGGNAQVTSVTATGPGDSWAVGLVCAPNCPQRKLDVLHRGGSGGWKTVATPKGLLPTAATSAQGAVVGASSAANAWAFVLLDQLTSSYTDALHWTGKAWKVTKLPKFTQITSTEVFGVKNAWAFGTTGATGKPYDLRYNGSAWHTEAMPGSPLSVSATSATDMWAVGPTTKTAVKPLGQQSYIAMHWTGTAWHTVALPNVAKPAGDFVVPNSIVALGPANVWEDYSLGNAGTCCVFGGLEHWTGKAWHDVSIPLPVDRATSMAPDGHGGIWMIVSDGSTLSLVFYHFNGGHWSSAKPPEFINVTIEPAGLAWVPGTRTEWTGGEGLLATGTWGEILAYS
jgi:hypothetical protein